MAILYRHIRLDNNTPFYIGIGVDEKRAYSRNNRNKYWKSIFNKSNIEIEILFKDLTWDEACIKEKEFITLYGRNDLGLGTLCNMTDGGEGTIGYVWTENHRKLIGEANKNRIISNETKLKISQSKKGKKLTEEQYKRRMEWVSTRIEKRGIEHHNFGKKMSEEQKLKLTGKRNILAWNSGKKRTDINGGKHGMAKIVLNTQTGIFYDYCKEAAKYEDYNYYYLISMLTGKKKNTSNLIYV